MYWVNAGVYARALWERKLAPSASFPASTVVHGWQPRRQQPFANVMEANFRLELTPGKAEWRKEENRDPEDSNPKALPISRPHTYVSQ